MTAPTIKAAAGEVSREDQIRAILGEEADIDFDARRIDYGDAVERIARLSAPAGNDGVMRELKQVKTAKARFRLGEYAVTNIIARAIAMLSLPQARGTKSAPVLVGSVPSGQSDPSVTTDCAGADTQAREAGEDDE